MTQTELIQFLDSAGHPQPADPRPGGARSVLYEPVESHQKGESWENVTFREESTQTTELYETFFDRSINQAEREAVIQAARSTWSINQAQASLQAVDEREVHLLRQELNLTEYGDWAEAELYEVYQNETGQRQGWLLLALAALMLGWGSFRQRWEYA